MSARAARLPLNPGGMRCWSPGSRGARDGLIGLVKAFDIDILARQSYALLPVSSGDVKDFATALQEAFKGQSGGALAGLVRVIPLSRINAVLVVSSQQRYIEEARRVYALIDRMRRQTLRSWHVYYLQNSHSQDVAYVLQQAFTPGNVTAQPTNQGQRSQGGLSGARSATAAAAAVAWAAGGGSAWAVQLVRRLRRGGIGGMEAVAAIGGGGSRRRRRRLGVGHRRVPGGRRRQAAPLPPPSQSLLGGLEPGGADQRPTH